MHAIKSDGKSTTKEKLPEARSSGRLKGWHYVLLLLPYIALLSPATYARETPQLFGFPFFYWYQFLWVFLSASLTGIVYWRTRS
ncbi:MAG: DUF3311 domain-containing protein [Edaphobacter sp.]